MSRKDPRGELRTRTFLRDDETEGEPLYALVDPAGADHVLLGCLQIDQDDSTEAPLFWFTRTQAIEVATALLLAVQKINERPEHQREDDE